MSPSGSFLVKLILRWVGGCRHAVTWGDTPRRWLTFLDRVYYLNDVASVISKMINGKPYYYLAVSARVDGKPRIVEQKYLGSGEDIEAVMAGATTLPSRTRHLAFGDLAATWGVIEKLGVIEIVDDVLGARRGDAGASVGTYVALAAANRVVDPCSKLKFAGWWSTTTGDHLVKIGAVALDHRRFWDAMHVLNPQALTEIERRISARAITVFGLDISSLALDMTNFATFIDSTNVRAPIAQRGKAKQKRTDLRLVGLGLVITRDGGIPLLSHAYPGNLTDVTQFGQMIEELTARHRGLGGTDGELTVVFDAGQNSRPNFELLDRHRLHYVGSLPPSDHQALLEIPTTDYRRVVEFDGVTARETDLDALGLSHRAEADPFRRVAQRPVPRFRPDPDQNHPPTHQHPRHPHPGTRPPQQDKTGNRHHLDLRTPLGQRGTDLATHRGHPTRYPTGLPDRHRRP